MFENRTVKCRWCGKFISYQDMDAGYAQFYFEPLNEYGPEVSEWTCKNCNNKEADDKLCRWIESGK